MGLNFNPSYLCSVSDVWTWNSNEGDLTQNDPFIPELLPLCIMIANCLDCNISLGSALELEKCHIPRKKKIPS